LPGDYQVKLTANGKTQTAPLHLAIDPRTKGQEAELQKQFALSREVTDRISQLHEAVNGIREIRAQIKTLHDKFGEEVRVKAALDSADAMERKMSEVEQQLMQVNMKGSEGNLAFPNMLNEAFDSFSHSIDVGDREPTQPQLDVFAALNARLDDQLKKWSEIKEVEMPKVIAMIKQADLPALVIEGETRGSQ
jgi:seryl-tRNA synthetase